MLIGFNCDDPANKAVWLAKNSGNIAGSCQLGFMPMFGSRTCYGMSGFTAKKCKSGILLGCLNIHLLI